jgi:hypothetical protein
MSRYSMINTFDFSCLVDCLRKAFVTLKLDVKYPSFNMNVCHN